MEHSGPSIEDLIHSIHQDVFNQTDSYSPMFANGTITHSHNQFPQNRLWDHVSAIKSRNNDVKNENQMLQLEGDVHYQADRPRTPYYTPSSNQLVVHSSPASPLQTNLQPHPTPSYTTILHEEVTFTPPPTTNYSHNGGIWCGPVERSVGSVVGSQPVNSPRDGQFIPQPPLEPRKSRTRSSIRRAAKLLLNRSKQVLSNSDSNISRSSLSTPVPPGKGSKKKGESSVTERLSKNRARMGELLKSPKWRERRQSSEEKENSYVIHQSNDITNVHKPRHDIRARHGSGHIGRRFHSMENVNASVLSSDSSHYSGSELNDGSSNYMDDVSFDGSVGSGVAGYALRRYNSGPILHDHHSRREHHRGYHTADSDTDSSLSKGETHYMAVQNRFGSGRQVKSTREALKKLNRQRSVNGQHSRLGGTPKHTSTGPLKADHTIQPFIHNERLQDSFVQERWKGQGARPKYASSTESLETESVNHEIFPDTAIRSDSEDHRGSRSSLVGRHSMTASPSRSVRFEDEEFEMPTTDADLRKVVSFSSPQRTSTMKQHEASDVRYRQRYSDNGEYLKDGGKAMMMIRGVAIGDDSIDGDDTDFNVVDPVQRHWGHRGEGSGRPPPPRTSEYLNGDDISNNGSDDTGAMDNGCRMPSTAKDNRYDYMSEMTLVQVGRGQRMDRQLVEEEEEEDINGMRADFRKPRSKSPFLKGDGHYPMERSHVTHESGRVVSEEVTNEERFQDDNLDQLQDAIEPAYEEVKRAKKAYATHANHYFDAIQAHSAWDEYKRKLQEENERQPGSFAAMSFFAKNRDHISNISGSNLSIASNSSISEKMQHLGHATKQTFGKMRRALSLDKISKTSQRDDGFHKESKLKRSPSLRSLSSFFGKKKDKWMGSFSDLSTKESRSASISGLSFTVQEQVDVTSPSYMRKIGRVLDVFDDGTQLVRLVKPPTGPFGFYIAKGASTNGPGIFVKRIGDGHPTKMLAGLLQIGDEIIEINGHRVKEEKNIDVVYDLILDNDDLVLKIRPLVRRGTELS